jgi:hypothetical protein
LPTQRQRHPKAAHRQQVSEFASVDVQTTCISKMRSKSIRIKTCRILPRFTHFPASIVANFNFLDHLEPSARHDKDGVAIQCFPTDTIQFEEVKASQSDRHKCKISNPASRLSTSMRGSHLPSWRKGVDNDEIAERWRIHCKKESNSRVFIMSLCLLSDHVSWPMLSAEAAKRSGKLRKVTINSAVKLFLECKVVKYIIVPLTTRSVQGHIENRDNFSDAIRDLFLDTDHFSSVCFVSREINLIDSRR